MRPDGDKEAPGALARPAWGEEGAPACTIVPDGGMKASQGNRPPRAAFTHPAEMAMRRKRERPPRRPCPGGRSTAAGEKGENPPHRPPGNGWGENRRPRPCYAEEPGAPYGREAPVRWRVAAGERFGTRSPPSFRHGGPRPVAFTHPTVCVPVVQSDSAGMIFMEPDHIPAGHQAAGAVDDQVSDPTPGVTVKQGQCRVPGPQVCGWPALPCSTNSPEGLTCLRPTPVRV